METIWVKERQRGAKCTEMHFHRTRRRSKSRAVRSLQRVLVCDWRRERTKDQYHQRRKRREIRTGCLHILLNHCLDGGIGSGERTPWLAPEPLLNEEVEAVFCAPDASLSSRGEFKCKCGSSEGGRKTQKLTLTMHQSASDTGKTRPSGVVRAKDSRQQRNGTYRCPGSLAPPSSSWGRRMLEPRWRCCKA